MVQYLEELLREKTQGSQSDILHAQWIYDKKVIPSALQSVSNLFPHYSLHDESHSATIINNIVRVVGKDNMSKLSAIDIWLILEAAYCHDLGMVVSSDKMFESLNSDSFLTFFKDLLKDPKDGLHEFAKNFNIEDGKIKFTSEIFSLEVIDSIKFILAEYFRRIHADRSKEIINNPHQQLSIASPRGVIPPRIIKILGDICSCHTKNFEDVMALPFSAVGVDIDDAHPRFIACLLRIGDLLDLDNNRFSEVMLRTLTKVPVDTLNHKLKHLSIEAFRADNEKIEIVAKCDNYDVANITQHWFNYINSEVSQQMIKWNEIVPYKELCYLPTIGDLKVELETYDFIDGKNKPKFNVDTDKALDLLKGAGLYDGAYQCIREILQNSVDATLFRVWLEESESISNDNPESILSIAKKYPISINIVKKQEEGDYQLWEIIIKDNGVGISSNDLRFLMKAGSSSKNSQKAKLEEEMPLWVRPSGTFGIGFQSVFMLTDMVEIETKSFFDEQFQIIELNNPNSKRDGDILVRKQKTNHSVKPHTQLKFIYKTEKIPKRYSINSEHVTASKIAEDYDPFTNESLDIELGKIIDEIVSFSNRSYFPVELSVDNESLMLYGDNDKPFLFYDSDNALEFNIYIKSNQKWRSRYFYKNQEVDNNRNYIFLTFDVNIHKDKASEALTLNRNKLRKDYDVRLASDVLKSLFKIITTRFDEVFKDEEEKKTGSMFLQYFCDYEEVKHVSVSEFNHWEKILLGLGEESESKSMQLGEVVNSVDNVNIRYIKSDRLNPVVGSKDKYSMEGKKLIIHCYGSSINEDVTRFILKKLRSKIKFIVNRKQEQSFMELEYGKDFVPLENVITMQEILSGLINQNPYSARAIIPCFEENKKLRLKDDAGFGYVYEYFLEGNFKIAYQKMLSPYVRIEQADRRSQLSIVLNDNFYQWVYENRYNPETTIEEIKDGYAKFVEKYELTEINGVKVN